MKRENTGPDKQIENQNNITSELVNKWEIVRNEMDAAKWSDCHERKTGEKSSEYQWKKFGRS